MIDKRGFRYIVDAALKKAGYERRSGAWYLLSSEVVAVFEPQKSNYDNTYFINIGLYLRGLGSETEPKERLCHIRCRVEDLIDVDPELFDLDSPAWSAAEHAAEIGRILGQNVLPRINQFLQFDGLQAAHIAGVFRGCFVHSTAEKLLSQQ